MRNLFVYSLIAVSLFSCQKVSASPLLQLPPPPTLSPAGEKLIIEQEVDHPYKNSYPQVPDARLSGVTEGVGYDNHMNASSVIISDWNKLGDISAKRLANTHPYYGRSAQQHLKDVKDILVKWDIAVDVFNNVDVARTNRQCERIFPGFDDLRPNAQAALISLVFNRGSDLTGPNRSEMRDIRDAIPSKDYSRIANDLRKMVRVWRGTSIQADMTRRRNAEADLVLVP